MAIPEWLYRGVSCKMHAENCGELRPKVTSAFTYQAKWGEFNWGESQRNAILRHQHKQEGFPTSGIQQHRSSTVPSSTRWLVNIVSRGLSTRSTPHCWTIFQLLRTELQIPFQSPAYRKTTSLFW